MSFVGATLKLAPSVSPSNVAPKYSAIFSGVLEDTKRPHMARTLPRSPAPTPGTGLRRHVAARHEHQTHRAGDGGVDRGGEDCSVEGQLGCATADQRGQHLAGEVAVAG